MIQLPYAGKTGGNNRWSGLLLDFLGDFVGKFFKFALLQLDTLAFEILHDVVTSLFALFREQEGDQLLRRLQRRR